MEFRTLYQGKGAAEGGVWLLRTHEEWQRYWERTHQADRQPPGPRPDEMVVLVALGLRGTGGFGVCIHRMVKENGVLHVFATETRPGPEHLSRRRRPSRSTP